MTFGWGEKEFDDFIEPEQCGWHFKVTTPNPINCFSVSSPLPYNRYIIDNHRGNMTTSMQAILLSDKNHSTKFLLNAIEAYALDFDSCFKLIRLYWLQ